MRVIEEPFTTRDSILAVYRPGLAPKESPFRTLRKGGCVSSGLRVEMRTRLGHFLGHAQLYSSLNADAARAMRLGEAKVAKQLAIGANRLERSPDAEFVRAAVQAVGAGLSADPLRAESPLPLRRYLQLRRRGSLLAVDDMALTREWLVQSEAWLGAGRRAELESAVASLARGASEARADLLGDGRSGASTFFGIVRRMDATAAEVEGDEGGLLVPRRDLEREGLAVLGQAVALLCEALPAGGTLVIPRPAIAIDQPQLPSSVSPWDIDAHLEDGAMPASIVSAEDQEWIERGLAHERSAVPLAALARR
jgi:hypothetical protein